MKRLLGEYAVPALFGLLFLGIIGLIVISAIGRKTYTIPAEYCLEQATGRTRERMETSYQCFSYDSKTGACSMNIPVTNYYTDKEVRITCDYMEWK